MSLELPDWNTGLRLEVEQPVALAVGKGPGAGRTQGVGRVKAGVQGTVGAAQRRWATEDAAGGLRAEGLDALPNALEAEYWLRKAAAEEAAGCAEAAMDVLREALERDVRPVTDVLRAMQELGKRGQAEQATAEDVAGVLSEVGNRAPARTFTPSKTGLTGKALRVPSRFARSPGTAAKAAATVGKASEAAPAPAGAQPTLQSVLKRLTFSAVKPALRAKPEPAAAHAAGATATPGPTGSKPPGRHVSFGAGTVSPQAQAAAPRSSLVQFQTPQAIDEDDAENGSPAASQVNSVGAGRTPYDSSRLSGLFRKYHLSGTPGLASDEEDEDSLDGGLAGKSPSWRALSSSVSISDSIRGLAKKYNPDVDSLSFGLGSPELTPLATTPLAPASAAGSQGRGGNGASPAMAPTPHHLLAGWQRNDLYESPGQQGGTGAGGAQQPAAPAGAPEAQPQQQTPVQQRGGENAMQASDTASPEPLLHGEITPSGAVHLAVAAAAFRAPTEPESPATQAGTPLASTEIDLSPVSAGAGSSTPAAGATPGVDGVLRNADGIPLVTPATVTVARGGSAASFRDDGIASNLFESFESPQAGGDDFSFAPIASQPSAEQQQEEEEGDTPNLQPRPASEEGEVQAAETPAFAFQPTPCGVEPSPEILGYHEQQEAAAAAAAGAIDAGAEEEPAVFMPRSILKAQQLAADGTPALGRAQRVPSPTKLPRSTATKELRALMADLTLEDTQGGQAGPGLGTLPMLSPIRAAGHLRAQLGVDKVVTPVRRSARNKATHATVEEALEAADFSYVPNEALLSEDAAAARDKLAKAAKKPASASKAAEEGPEAAAKAETSKRPAQSARKSRLSASAASAEEDVQQATAEGAAPAIGGRYNLRRSSMASPAHAARPRLEAEDAEVPTPADAGLGPQAPAPQDASPTLQESLGASAAAGQPCSARKSAPLSTPAATPVAAAANGQATQRITRRRASIAAAATPQAISMSPTEQGIRSALRRSARKSGVMRQE